MPGGDFVMREALVPMKDLPHLHSDLGVIGPDQVVEVTLNNAANVQLLDAANYEHYRNQRPYEYHGGHTTHSPVRLRPPHKAHWYLTVDLGGMPGTVYAGLRILAEPSTDTQ